MRPPSILLILAASFFAAAIVGAIFVLGGAVSGGAFDAIPARASVVAECREASGFRRLVESIRPGGRRAPLPEWVDRLAFASEALGSGRIVLAAIPDSEQGDPTLLVVFRPGGSAASARLFNEVRALVGGDAGRWLGRTYRGHSYEVLSPGLASGAPCIGRRRDDLIVAQSAAGCVEAFDTADGRQTPISASALFRGSKEHWEKQSQVGLYLARAAFHESAVPPLARAAGEWLGLGEVEAISASFRTKGGRVTESVDVLTGQSRSGLASALAEAVPVELALARGGRLLPGDLPLYALFSLPEPAAAWDHLPDLAGASGWTDPEGLRSRMKGLDQILNVQVGRDLLGAFGAELLVGLDPGDPLPRGGARTRLSGTTAVAAWSIARPAAFRGLVSRLEGMARLLDGARRKDESGAGIVSWEIPSLAPLRPSYRYSEQFLAAATAPSLLGEVAESPERSLAEHPEIAALRAKLPRRSHAMIFARSERLSERLDDLWPVGAKPPDAGLFALAVSFHRKRVHIESHGPSALALEWLAPHLVGAFGGVRHEPAGIDPSQSPVHPVDDEPL